MRSFGSFCSLSLALALLFAGCDNAPASPPRSSATSDPGSKRPREAPSSRPRSPRSNGENGRSGGSTGSPDAPKPPPSAKGDNAQGANGSDARGENGSGGSGGSGRQSGSRSGGGSENGSGGSGRQSGSRSGGGSENGSGGSSGGGSENGGNGGSGGDRVPAGWLSTAVKQPPSATDQEIWDNIIAAIKPLIVAQQVEFAPLGSANTSLAELKKNQYKAAGRCVVSEKNGARSPFDFECVAAANKYEAIIISVDFHSPNR